LDETSFAGSSITDKAQLRASTGALLFIDTPIGPMELSFGFPIVKEKFDDREIFRLSVGTRF
jgi:outer membrane protein insertion porin family